MKNNLKKLSENDIKNIQEEAFEDLQGYIYNLDSKFHELDEYTQNLIANAFLNGYVTKALKD